MTEDTSSATGKPVSVGTSAAASPTWQCPNCGKWQHYWQRRCSSTFRSSGFSSTLYGVCQECANAHSAFDRGWNQAPAVPPEHRDEK